MKTLSLLQPWATLVAIGAKKIETRSWSTRYRGPLLIHASQGRVKEAEALIETYPFKELLRDFASFSELPRGVILARCDLVDCRSITPQNPPEGIELYLGDFNAGRYAWYLENVSPLPPIPAQGKLGLWECEGFSVDG